MKKLFFIAHLFLIGCSQQHVVSKHSDQSKAHDNAPSFHDQCASGAYGEWAKGFHCAPKNVRP